MQYCIFLVADKVEGSGSMLGVKVWVIAQPGGFKIRKVPRYGKGICLYFLLTSLGKYGTYVNFFLPA